MIEQPYWARPSNSRKFHVFKNTTSLCGKWWLINPYEPDCVPVKETDSLGKEDCKACFQKSRNQPYANKEGKS